CLLLPAALWIGLPRAALVGAALPAGAAWALSRAARSAGGAALPNNVLATAPLVVIALLTGDLGSPWLAIVGGRATLSPDAYQIWSAQGLLTVERKYRKHMRLHVDGHDCALIIEPGGGARREGTRHSDVVHALPAPAEASVLLVSTGGGRQAQMALDRGAQRVVALERYPKMVSHILLDGSADLTGRLYESGDRLEVRVGDGRAAIEPIPGLFDRVVVVAAEPLVQVPTRLLAWTDRLQSHEAIRDYLDRMTPDGVLSISTAPARLPQVTRAVAVALESESERVARQLYACAAGGGNSTLIATRKPLTRKQKKRLDKQCRTLRMRPVTELGSYLGLDAEQSDEEQPPGATTVAYHGPAPLPTDDRPFLDQPPSLRQLASISLEALDALTRTQGKAPGPGAMHPKFPPDSAAQSEGKPSRRAGAGRKGTPTQDDGDSSFFMAVVSLTSLVALGLAVLVLAVALLRSGLAARRYRCGTGEPLLITGAAFGYGGALSTAMLTAHEWFTAVTGHSLNAWLLAIPLALVGAGGARLAVDSVSPRRLRRTVAAVAAGAVVATLCTHALFGAVPSLWSMPSPVSLTIASVVVLLLSALLGAPLAAALRLAHRRGDALAAWTWAGHAAGWALGLAAAQLLARAVGIRNLLVLAVVLAVGATALLLVARGRRPSPPAPGSPTPAVPTGALS
ncbi:MAG: hypothetical protein JRI23_32840, partial [Deltaproteobacteria bacterium]|nr:hypothetical protein [Deltaproteobacteria bacterium]MBW2537040.1 hypothetical protein [Deltaproteobacteria bacterium]